MIVRDIIAFGALYSTKANQLWFVFCYIVINTLYAKYKADRNERRIEKYVYEVKGNYSANGQ